MSLCRFSDDDFQSDVYVYEAGDGRYDVLTRKQHLVWDIELPEPVDLLEDPEGWARRAKAIVDYANTGTLNMLDGKAVETHHWVPLEIPKPQWPAAGDDENYLRIFEVPRDAARWLTQLRAAGFHVPERVIPELLARQERLDTVPPDYDPTDEEMP